ncbi:MAG: hypothetical protein ACR2GP_11510 [Burkholderiaceae bacterium]
MHRPAVKPWHDAQFAAANSSRPRLISRPTAEVAGSDDSGEIGELMPVAT